MGFSEKIISWYIQNKRDLPWRKSNDPYLIWLSEIILQQTRVDQGLDYFNKFIKKYPKVNSLANAPEQDILKLWQGLGYYSRARNLHYTAKFICTNHGGNFPKKYEDILALKGIGEYTAAAISSFAYNQSYPVIDGNVFRVLSRVFGVKEPIDTGKGKKTFKELANELIDKDNPATYNQSIMEFGALQCTPKKPKCESCPFLLECYAFKNAIISELPVKEKKIKQRDRFFNYLVIIADDKIYLKKRKEKDIWIGLYDFPLIETSSKIEEFEEINFTLKKTKLTLKKKSIEHKHILSHQKIYATFWLVSVNKKEELRSNYAEIPLAEINNYPVPKLIENYLQSIL